MRSEGILHFFLWRAVVICAAIGNTACRARATEIVPSAIGTTLAMFSKS
jgi:hypothetical protein